MQFALPGSIDRVALSCHMGVQKLLASLISWIERLQSIMDQTSSVNQTAVVSPHWRGHGAQKMCVKCQSPELGFLQVRCVASSRLDDAVSFTTGFHIGTLVVFSFAAVFRSKEFTNGGLRPTCQDCQYGNHISWCLSDWCAPICWTAVRWKEGACTVCRT